jgi:hypothetical protein
MANPCIVIQRLTLIPMAATLCPSTHTPVKPESRFPSIPESAKARMITSSN